MDTTNAGIVRCRRSNESVALPNSFLMYNSATEFQWQMNLTGANNYTLFFNKGKPLIRLYCDGWLWSIGVKTVSFDTYSTESNSSVAPFKAFKAVTLAESYGNIIAASARCSSANPTLVSIHSSHQVYVYSYAPESFKLTVVFQQTA